MTDRQCFCHGDPNNSYHSFDNEQMLIFLTLFWHINYDVLCHHQNYKFVLEKARNPVHKWKSTKSSCRRVKKCDELHWEDFLLNPGSIKKWFLRRGQEVQLHPCLPFRWKFTFELQLEGVVHKWRQIRQMLIVPHSLSCSYMVILLSVVTKSLTPLPNVVTSFMNCTLY